MSYPVTPKRKPVERQKSPLSNEAYFSSPASVMPGAFPTTPPASSPSQNANVTPSPMSKRPGSVRNFLSFKALRRSYDNTSLGSRPASAGGESLAASVRPSLNKKKSGTFWRRKSSLGMNFGEDTPASPASSVARDEMSIEKERPMIPAPDEDIPRVQKRKSGTFWRRKSSLNLAGAFAGMNGKENQPQNVETKGGPTVPADGNANGEQNGLTNGKHKGEEDVTMEDVDRERSQTERSQTERSQTERSQYERSQTERSQTERSLSEFDEPLPRRSWSPPPQLPMFVGGGGGLGGAELFKDIH